MPGAGTAPTERTAASSTRAVATAAGRWLLMDRLVDRSGASTGRHLPCRDHRTPRFRQRDDRPLAPQGRAVGAGTGPGWPPVRRRDRRSSATTADHAAVRASSSHRWRWSAKRWPAWNEPARAAAPPARAPRPPRRTTPRRGRAGRVAAAEVGEVPGQHRVHRLVAATVPALHGVDRDSQRGARRPEVLHLRTSSTSASEKRRCPLGDLVPTGKPNRFSHVRSMVGVEPGAVREHADAEALGHPSSVHATLLRILHRESIQECGGSRFSLDTRRLPCPVWS